MYLSGMVGVMLDICLVIPVYNEEKVIAAVLDEIRRQGDFILIVVDDGSRDQSYRVAREKGAITLRHRINRGKGAAVKTGIEAAKRCKADVIVTIDGDGQHDPGDIAILVQPILEQGYDVVLGSRLLDHRGMPFIKVVANKVGNLFTWLFYGIYVSDSQSGFRAFSKYAAAVIDTRADKYEYDSKVIREIKNNRLKFIEVPVQVRYTEYSMGKKQKQGFVNGLRTLVRMIWDMLV
jgi:glycosyltransferase involved in cell wall biosynthesis